MGVKILIIGSTGNIGKHVVSYLTSPPLAEYVDTIFATTRNVESQQAQRLLGSKCVQLIASDILSDESMKNAVSYGVDAVFFCIPQTFSPDDMVRAHQVLANAVVNTDVTDIIKISSLGVDSLSTKYIEPGQGPLGDAHARGEQILREGTTTHVTSLRPTSFSTNFAVYDAPSLVSSSSFCSPLGSDVPTANVNWIDVRDIALAAAVILAIPAKRSEYRGRVIDITGPPQNTLNAADMTQVVEQALQRMRKLSSAVKVSYTALSLPPEDGGGMSSAYRKLWEFLRAGGFDCITMELEGILRAIEAEPRYIENTFTELLELEMMKQEEGMES